MTLEVAMSGGQRVQILKGAVTFLNHCEASEVAKRVFGVALVPDAELNEWRVEPPLYENVHGFGLAMTKLADIALARKQQAGQAVPGAGRVIFGDDRRDPPLIVVRSRHHLSSAS